MKMFLDALRYPIQRGGWVMILTGAVFYVVLQFCSALLWILSLAILIFSIGYFGAFYLEIINTAIVGKDDIPNWPGIGDFVADILMPVGRLFVLGVLSFGPLIALIIFAHETAWLAVAMCVGVAYGCLYFPMAVLAAQSFGNAFAAMPHVVFPAIIRASPCYLLATLGLVVAVIVLEVGESMAGHLPFIGWLLAAAVSIYILMFQARLIGLIYREKQDVIGWE